jgi:hypothetical protein
VGDRSDEPLLWMYRVSGSALLIAAGGGFFELWIGPHGWTRLLQLAALVAVPFWLSVALNWRNSAERFATLAKAGGVIDVDRAHHRTAAELLAGPYMQTGSLRAIGAVISVVGVGLSVSAIT